MNYATHLPFSFFFSFFLKVTHFTCGGISLGLSWAHILGDPISASEFINSWGQVLANMSLNKPCNIVRPNPMAQGVHNPSLIDQKDPISAKRANSVGDHWVPANNCKMDTFSFHLTSSQLNYLQAQIWGPSIEQTPHFESLCAIIWRCIAEIRGGSEPNIVTVCKKDPYYRGNDIIGNNRQLIAKVEAKTCIVDTDLRKLARMLVDEAVDERKQIEEVVDRDQGAPDFFIYGANLTFIDLEEADLYGLELNGQKPKFVYYIIQGVGDEGVVMVLPRPKDSTRNGNDGKLVTIILPEDQMEKLKSELKKNGLLFEGDLE